MVFRGNLNSEIWNIIPSYVLFLENRILVRPVNQPKLEKKLIKQNTFQIKYAPLPLKLWLAFWYNIFPSINDISLHSNLKFEEV